MLQRHGILDGPKVLQVLLVSQRQPQRCDLSGGTLTEMGKRAVEDLPIGAIRLAPQRPRRRCAITKDVRGIDLYSGYYNSYIQDIVKE